MTQIINIILLALAGLCFLAVILFVGRAFGARARVDKQSYGVGQQETRRAFQVDLLRAGLFLLLGLILLGVFGLAPRPAAETDEPAPPLLQPTATQPAPTQAPPPTNTPASSPTATAAPPPTATSQPTPSPTAPPVTATVSSGVGVWLRAAPGTTGEQLEWLLDGTVVTLLPGQQTADELLWQQVRAESGVEGWVARDFLVIDEPGS